MSSFCSYGVPSISSNASAINDFDSSSSYGRLRVFGLGTEEEAFLALLLNSGL